MRFNEIYVRIRKIIFIVKKAKLASEQLQNGIWKFL